MPEFGHLRDHVKFSVTGEGLRIDLLESEQGMFFVSGSPAPTAAGQHLLQVLATRNRATAQRHRDRGSHGRAGLSGNAGPATGYSNWELASDRANAARRLLHAVRGSSGTGGGGEGFANQRPFNNQDRNDARNRRVSVVVRFTA